MGLFKHQKHGMGAANSIFTASHGELEEQVQHQTDRNISYFKRNSAKVENRDWASFTQPLGSDYGKRVRL